MDDQQRARAGQAVAMAMDQHGWSYNQLAAMSEVAAVTIRDLCSGKRWPWTAKRNSIEAALGWETGRIAQIAKGNVTNDHRPNAGTGCADPTHGMTVEDALIELLTHSDLSRARRAKVLAFYLDMLEDQDAASAG